MQKLFGEVTNIGMNSEISIGDLTNLIVKLIGVDVEVEIDELRIRPKSSEVDRLFCDNTKLKRYTKWTPNFSLSTGLEEVIDWMKKPSTETIQS